MSVSNHDAVPSFVIIKVHIVGVREQRPPLHKGHYIIHQCAQRADRNAVTANSVKVDGINLQLVAAVVVEAELRPSVTGGGEEALLSERCCGVDV